MSQSQTLLPSSPTVISTAADACLCERPLPSQRAERKGAAVTVCLRCGLRVPLRLR